MKFRCVNWQKSVGGVLLVVAIDKGNSAENRRWPLLIEDMEDPLRLQSEIFGNTSIPVNSTVAFHYVPLATSEGFRAGEPVNLPQFNTVRLHTSLKKKECFKQYSASLQQEDVRPGILPTNEHI